MYANSHSWPLQVPTSIELTVLAECWGVPAGALEQRDRPWVQGESEGDAPGPRVVDLADRRLTVFAPEGETARVWLPRMIGLRGLLALETVRCAPAGGVVMLGAGEQDAALALHARTADSELAAASPSPQESELALGIWDDGLLVAVAAVVLTAAGPPEVSVLVDPAHRRRGLAKRVEMGLIALAAGRWSWLQHRTILEDVASQDLAAACGFRLVSIEHLVRATG